MSPSCFCEFAEQINQRLVRFTVLRVKAWDGVAEIRVIELRIFVDLACQKTLTKRTKWNESDPEFFKRRQHHFFRLPPPERVLALKCGEWLRAIATLGDQSHRTAKAIAWLRANYTKPLRVEELAEIARMGMSTLHHHFRALTAMSPLQYQKQLRLVAARERMLVEWIDAASAAFEVGYKSASQFNREYKRFFGQPPMRDIKVRRLAGFAMVSD